MRKHTQARDEPLTPCAFMGISQRSVAATSRVKESQMAHQGFSHFSELYRAAFAEPNLERKLFLLSEVRKAMERWQQQEENAASAVGVANIGDSAVEGKAA